MEAGRMRSHPFVLTSIVTIAIASGGASDLYAQLPNHPLPAYGNFAWEVRLGKIPDRANDSWVGTLEQISRGYSLRWLAYASAAGRGNDADGLEDPVDHSFLGIQDGSRTLLVPEGLVLVGNGGIDAIRIQDGDTILRIPGSLLAEKRLHGLPSGETKRRVTVRIQTLGIQSIQELHPAHAASASRLLSYFPLPDEDWSEEERRASAAWMEQLRKSPIDYVVLERFDPVLGVCQMVLPIRASLLSRHASSFLERHVDSFAAIPIESSDRITCLDSAMLATVWLPWQTRARNSGASLNRAMPLKCSTLRQAIR